jgi:2-polyprenyl-6-methoxyphenol hydroxylase-like FAD-dependent oxidoreductase
MEHAMPELGEHAVILGASMGGLLAARVLADFYRNVTVVERDRLPATPVNRRGVPQGKQIHALAARGMQILDELFGDFADELRAGGVVSWDDGDFSDQIRQLAERSVDVDPLASPSRM